MKTFTRLLVSAVLLTLIVGLVVGLLGWLLKWNVSTQFSNGFFWAGGILVSIGVLSAMGGYYSRAHFGIIYSQSAGDMTLVERARQWNSDISQGHYVMILLMISGGLLLGVAIVIGGGF